MREYGVTEKITSAAEFVDAFIEHQMLHPPKRRQAAKAKGADGTEKPKARRNATIDSETLKRLYLDEKLTARQIAQAYGMPIGGVKKALERNGIRREK